MSANGEIDKKFLYGKFESGQEWQNTLNRKAAHKALDIPEDMPITVHKNGLGWKELLAIGAMGMLGLGTGVGGLAGVGGLMYLLNKPAAAPAAAANPPPISTDTDTDTQYDFDISTGRR